MLRSLLEFLQRFVRGFGASGQPEKRALTSRHRTGHYRRKTKEKQEKENIIP
jgi:hypothetical protein